MCSFSAPSAPTFDSSTTSQIVVTFTTVDDQLTYYAKATGSPNSETIEACNLSGRKCTVKSLRPGTRYEITVRACIKEQTSNCGDYSTPPLIAYTLPSGKHIVICSGIFHLLTIFYQNQLGPIAPSLNARTDSSITVSVSKPGGNEQDLIYKFTVTGDGVTGSTEQSCTGTTCTASGLKPGRPYRISVRACIKAQQARCGDFSPAATISTVPQGK